MTNQTTTNKLFICSNLIPNSTDDYQVSGAEDWVIEQAVDHVIEDHGWMDSPQVREDIKNSLVDVVPPSS